MTLEKTYLIAPSDIVGIQYDCGHCHSTLTVPLAKGDRVISQCPNCLEPFLKRASSGKAEEEQLLKAFSTNLASLQSLASTSKIMLKLRYEAMEPAI